MKTLTIRQLETLKMAVKTTKLGLELYRELEDSEDHDLLNLDIKEMEEALRQAKRDRLNLRKMVNEVERLNRIIKINRLKM